MESIEKSIEIEAPVSKVYNQWTQFEEFPKFMEGIQEVKQLDDKHLHWVAAIGGKKKEWNPEIVEQIPEQRIVWRSTSGAANAGVVYFRPKDQTHTVVTLQMNYQPEGVVEHLSDSIGVLSRRVEEIFNDSVSSFSMGAPKPAGGGARFIHPKSNRGAITAPAARAG